MKHLIETASGQYVDLAAPNGRTLRLDDIAHALANLCRFTGHTSQFYSVAEHSILTMRIAGALTEDRRLSEIAMRHALLHDAHEAFIGDVSSPLKRLLDCQKLRDVARVLDNLISWKYRVDFARAADLVKQADEIALVVEAEALMITGPDAEEWGLPPAPLQAKQQFRQYITPKQVFLHYCNVLGIKETDE